MCSNILELRLAETERRRFDLLWSSEAKAKRRRVVAAPGVRAMASKAGIRVPEMEKMSIEHLKALKEQTDLEVNLLQDSLNNIRTATSRLEIASAALNDLSLRPQGISHQDPKRFSFLFYSSISCDLMVDVGALHVREEDVGASHSVSLCAWKARWRR